MGCEGTRTSDDRRRLHARVMMHYVTHAPMGPGETRREEDEGGRDRESS